MLGAGLPGPEFETNFDSWLAQEQTGQPPRPAFTELVGLAWTNRPDVRIAGLRSVMAADQVTIARWSLIKSADLSFGAGHIENPRSDGYVRFLPALSLELPLFDAGDFRRRVALAKLQSSRSQVEIERAARDLPRDLGAQLANLDCQATIFERVARAAADADRILPSREDGGLRSVEKKIFAARAHGKEYASRLAWTRAWIRFKLSLGLNPLTAQGLAAPADLPDPSARGPQ
jgi:outer membrane protein TolC